MKEIYSSKSKERMNKFEEKKTVRKEENIKKKLFLIKPAGKENKRKVVKKVAKK